MVGSDAFPIEIVPKNRGHSFVYGGVFQWLKPPKLDKFPIHKKNINFGQESELVARIASDWGVAVPWNLWYGFHGWLVGWLVGWLLCLT